MSELPPEDVPEFPPEDVPELPPEVEPELPPEVEPSPEPPSPSFRAGKAFASFALVLGAQFFTGIAVVIVALIVAASTGTKFNGLAGPWEAPTIAATVVISAIMAYVAARIWAWDLVRDRGDGGLGLRRVPHRWLLIAAGAGIAIALFYFGVAKWLIPFDPKTPLGPLAQFASGGLLARIVLALIALVYAPLVEEFLFRGLLFKGFSASWGAVAGGAVTTVLFVLLHLFETINYWPATFAVASMAVGALLLRIRSGSLYPSMALHFAYNAAVVATAFAG